MLVSSVFFSNAPSRPRRTATCWMASSTILAAGCPGHVAGLQAVSPAGDDLAEEADGAVAQVAGGDGLDADAAAAR